MTKKEFHEIHNYHVSESIVKSCIVCAHCKISDKPVSLVRWSGDGEYYPIFNLLCTYMRRPIQTGYLCVCNIFENGGGNYGTGH